jgi:hypothetical protein
MNNVVEILWASLHALDASSDLRKEKPVVLALKHNMLRVIAELEAARLPPVAAGPALVSERPPSKKPKLIGDPHTRRPVKQAQATVLRMRNRESPRH